MFERGTVKSIARKAKQPKGSYLPLKAFDKTVYDDGIVLSDDENVHGSLVGTAVEYITNVMLGESAEESFVTSLVGALDADGFGRSGSHDAAEKLVAGINGDDEQSVYNALQVVSFDVWYRDPSYGEMAPMYYDIQPNETTVRNTQVMVQRTIDLLNRFGGVKAHGFNFYPEGKDKLDYYNWIGRSKKSNFGGYSQKVYNGEGDYLTADTMFDIKVMKSRITNKYTLQLLMYWIMGQHSGQEMFKDIRKIGLFNPRVNTAYLLDMDTFSKDVIQAVERDVIEYA